MGATVDRSVLKLKYLLFPPSLDATAEPPALFDGTTRFYTWIAGNYKEEGCSENKGESLDFFKYIDEHFEGPSLLPDDSEKKKLAEDLLANFSDSFNEHIERPSLLPDDLEKKKFAEELLAVLTLSMVPCMETYLQRVRSVKKLVDIAYAPFIERFQLFFADIKSYDITKGRPKLALWIEELNKILPIQKKHDMILKC